MDIRDQELKGHYVSNIVNGYMRYAAQNNMPTLYKPCYYAHQIGTYTYMEDEDSIFTHNDDIIFETGCDVSHEVKLFEIVFDTWTSMKWV